MERRTQKLEKSIFAYVLTLICVSSVISFVSGCDPRTPSKPVAIQDKPRLQHYRLCLPLLRAERASPWPGERHMILTPPRDFYVLLSNVSKQPQTVWEDWNSWGYQAISFELTTADGKKHVLSKRQQDFTKNYPSTLVSRVNIRCM
jgi:hypothetical protein